MQDRDGGGAGWPGDGLQCLASGGGAGCDGDFQDLVAAQRGGRLAQRRLGAGLCPFGGELSLGGGDLLGDCLQDPVVGYPALHVLAVVGEHRQPVAAVGDQLVKRLAE